jgi:3-deoxy-7-phosphoheptulonate synthase
MNFEIIKKLIPMEEVIQSIPLSQTNHEFIRKSRENVKNILIGNDRRLLMIIGPCSAWPKEAVIEYAKKLSVLNKKVENALMLVMRVYTQKPRTKLGWTGPILQPDPLRKPDIEMGIKYTREMMVKVTELGLPIADELLFTHYASGLQGILSWAAIGARSSEDQEHRVFASALDCAVGLKNPTHGSLSVAVNSVFVAQQAHVAAIDGYEVQTAGNPYAHLVLRGSNQGPNYSVKHLEEANSQMNLHQLYNPSIIIDVSHGNCLIADKKDHTNQAKIIFEIQDFLKTRPNLKKLVKGFMVESFLKGGSQSLENGSTLDHGGLSITDPCLSWEQTEELILKLAAAQI